ncbi:MAG TPA: hypothetical protein VJ729_18935 [Nitrososphaeraceae archaeon]|nr:hypothetical protein [Nitrososphaeraceae archaeon]
MRVFEIRRREEEHRKGVSDPVLENQTNADSNFACYQGAILQYIFISNCWTNSHNIIYYNCNQLLCTTNSNFISDAWDMAL